MGKSSSNRARQWKQDNLSIMSNIIEAKAAQVPEFRERLLETEGTDLVEATYDKFWASGLSIDDTEKINPKFHPGPNKLGHLVMEIRDVLCIQDDLGEDDTQAYQTPGTSVFSADSDQTSLRQSP